LTLPRSRSLSSIIDHTLLRPDASLAEVEVLCRDATGYGFAAVCVNPWHVRLAAELLRGSDIAVCGVAGFPLGATTPWVKATEAQGAVGDGASEIDIVINLGALRSGRSEIVSKELSLVRSSIGDAVLKVILELPLLDRAEAGEGCRIALDCGANYLKTCTGFGPRGVTVDDVVFLRSMAAGRAGVKAAGGIKTLKFARELVAAGATRIGTSSAVAIAMEESVERGGRGSAGP
jgi:deoxyribose-phosphate aldolase